MGILPGTGRAAGQHSTLHWLAAASGGDSGGSSSRPPALSGSDAMAGAGFFSLVLLHLLLDHRTAGDRGKAAGLSPGNTYRMAGLGICRERRRSARAVAGHRGRLLGAGPADAGELRHRRGGCQPDSICRRGAGSERRGPLSQSVLPAGGAVVEQ